MHEELTKTISDMRQITKEAIAKVKKAISGGNLGELMVELQKKIESSGAEYVDVPYEFQKDLKEAGLYGKDARALTRSQCKQLRDLDMILQEQAEDFIDEMVVPRDYDRQQILIREFNASRAAVAAFVEDLLAQQDGFASRDRAVQSMWGPMGHQVFTLGLTTIALNDLEEVAGRIHEIHERLQLTPAPQLVIAKEPAERILEEPTASRTVFIVHGHDETNRLRLEKLLRERWDLEPVVLSYEPGRGRTLIEKFEQEGERSAYAIVLFTPDDLVEMSDTKYFQARPNAIFELGWFYGRLGRQRVCILFKKGTKIPSDLDGITRIEFKDSIKEKIEDIEKELQEAGLI